MEARSLASLNLLAGNPPQYPENPSEEPQEPLILYISRVPGTRDVILSPFKPQVKNVTGEDVANCLYYVHLEQALPDLPCPTPFRDEGYARSSGESSRTPPMSIPRKPLPSSAAMSLASLSLNPDPPSGSNQHQRPARPNEDQNLRPSPARGASFNSQNDAYCSEPPRPLNDSGLGLSDSSSDQAYPSAPKLHVSGLKRRPLGPRPPVHQPGEFPDALFPPLPQDRFPAEENARERQYMRSRADSLGVGRTSRSVSPMKRAEYLTAPFSLNLIRRDPGSGAQWNVGRISSHEMDGLSGGTDRPSPYLSTNAESPPSQQFPPIDIQIETSGYAKFRTRPTGHRTPSVVSDAAGFPRNDMGAFSRQVVMSYSKSWTSTIKSKFQQMGQAAQKKTLHSRHLSEASVNSTSSGEFIVGSPSSGQSDVQKTKPRGYLFTSPWGGKCQFRTGNGGRSVICYHTVHDGQAGGYNPLVADTSKPATVVVSDLRFNLPGSDLFPPSESPSRDSNKERRRGHFSKFLRSSTGAEPDKDEDDDMISPFDVNLGGEKAGGGNRGKRAKLGKLVVYHDGLKMLDLVVAANIGMWWGAWERSF